MASEIPDFPGQAGGEDILALFGSLYAVRGRDFAHAGKPWPASLSTFAPSAYVNALAKLSLASASKKAAGLSALEQRSLAIGIAAKQTFARHGARLPWVPARWSDVLAARAVKGATKDAIPSPENGVVCFDPFGFVPKDAPASDLALFSAARAGLRTMGKATETPIAGAVESPSITASDLGTGPKAAVPIILAVGGVLIIGAGVIYGINKWAEVKENEDDRKYYYESGTATSLVALNAALDLQTKRYAEAHAQGKPVEPPSALEQALIGKATSERPIDKWSGPLLGLGFCALTVGAIYLGAKWAKKDFPK